MNRRTFLQCAGAGTLAAPLLQLNTPRAPWAPGVIWQQPHPIYLAELAYRAGPSRALLARYSEMVFASAEFMASYPVWEE